MIGDAAIILPPKVVQQFTEQIEAFSKQLAGIQARNLAIEQPMTAKEAANYLRISESTMNRRFKDGRLPTNLIHRSGTSVYFFASELYDHLKKSK